MSTFIHTTDSATHEGADRIAKLAQALQNAFGQPSIADPAEEENRFWNAAYDEPIDMADLQIRVHDASIHPDAQGSRHSAFSQ